MWIHQDTIRILVSFLIAENDTSLTDRAQKNYGLMNNNEPYAKLDENAYIIMPKASKFSDASYEEDKGKAEEGIIAKLKYTYAGRVVGRANIVETGVKIEDSYFEQEKPEKTDGSVRTIWIKPAMFGVAFIVILILVVLIYLGKKLYDNYYLIRHRRQMRKIDRARFKVYKRRKRYHRRDRMFK